MERLAPLAARPVDESEAAARLDEKGVGGLAYNRTVPPSLCAPNPGDRDTPE